MPRLFIVLIIYDYNFDNGTTNLNTNSIFTTAKFFYIVLQSNYYCENFLYLHTMNCIMISFCNSMV